MKFNKLTNKIKLSSTLIAAATIMGGAILSVPLLLSTNHTNNQTISNKLDYKNIIDQDNNKSTGSSDFSSQPAEIRDFFSIYDNKKIYINNSSDSFFVVVTQKNGFDVLYAWGNNGEGQLGVNDKTNRSYPTLVPSLPPNSKITHVVASVNATTVVVNGDQIWVAGSNTSYEHGNPDLGNRQTFALNTKWTGGAVKSIHTGSYHRVVITADNVWVWGDNDYGQLGTGDKTDQSTPYDITGKITAANPNWASGEFYVNGNNTAMMVNGQLHMWGAGSNGRLGNNGTNDVLTPPSTPINFNGGRVKKYSMGGSHSLALLENGDLYSWGWNYFGQLGINSTANRLIPTKVTTMFDNTPITGVTDVFTSYASSFIQIDNKIYSCGNNGGGILAQGPTIANNVIFSPVILDSSAMINSIYSTYSNLIVNLESGLYMAGSNNYGQFANGDIDYENHHTLTQVTPFGTPTKLTSKLDNTRYTATEIVTDLNSKITTQEIRDALGKYVDGIETLDGTVLKYKTTPVASNDLSKVTLTLTSNSNFNLDGIKTNLEFDIPLDIGNLMLNDPKVASTNLGLIIGLSVGGVALVAIISFCIWLKLKRKRSELYIIR